MLRTWLGCAAVLLGAMAVDAAEAGNELPASWLAAWKSPGAELRPMQIVHGLPGRYANVASMKQLAEAGLGGIVCNVGSRGYLRDEEHWKEIVAAVEACREAGLVVWIYDEDGYPSAAAGGRVLERNPDLEAQVLARDPDAADGFVVRRAYEYTHASNNVFAKRRYPNLIDPATTRTFIETTHEQYWRRLEPHFGKTIKAFFTDEPSLMAVHLGDLNARVIDPLNPKVKLLATVPWCADLPEQYRKRYGEDLLAVRRSLFEGQDRADRAVRQRFWSLVSELMAERYFGQLQTWCGSKGVASSGHALWEEHLVHHVPLYGNLLQSLMRMDVPGLDMLSSDPMSATRDHGWMAASLPASAALFNGGRRVMTEVSDYSQGGKSDLSMMRGAAAWQAAMGVTEYTLYYGSVHWLLQEKPDGTHLKHRSTWKAYGDYVGRLNAILRPAAPDPAVLLYYPIYNVWGEYLPVAGALRADQQSARAKLIVNSFGECGWNLVTRQAPFAIADHELIGGAEVREGGLWIRGKRFGALVLPAGVELPEKAAGVVRRFAAAGGAVVRHPGPGKGLDERVLRSASAMGALSPASDKIVAGRFVRDGRAIVILVNVSTQSYSGRVAVGPGTWLEANPETGSLRTLQATEGGVGLTLPGRSALLFVGSGK